MKLLQQLVPMMNWMGNQMWIQMMMLMDVVMMAEVSVVIPFVVLVQYYDYFENDAAFERNYCCSMSFDCSHFHCLLLDFRTFCTKFQITTYKKKTTTELIFNSGINSLNKEQHQNHSVINKKLPVISVECLNIAYHSIFFIC